MLASEPNVDPLSLDILGIKQKEIVDNYFRNDVRISEIIETGRFTPDEAKFGLVNTGRSLLNKEAQGEASPARRYGKIQIPSAMSDSKEKAPVVVVRHRKALKVKISNNSYVTSTVKSSLLKSQPKDSSIAQKEHSIIDLP
jgi:tRNA 2-selenouridine synthase SelU